MRQVEEARNRDIRRGSPLVSPTCCLPARGLLPLSATWLPPLQELDRGSGIVYADERITSAPATRATRRGFFFLLHPVPM
jgi:hypothetical protein